MSEYDKNISKIKDANQGGVLRGENIIAALKAEDAKDIEGMKRDYFINSKSSITPEQLATNPVHDALVVNGIGVLADTYRHNKFETIPEYKNDVYAMKMEDLLRETAVKNGFPQGVKITAGDVPEIMQHFPDATIGSDKGFSKK